ncbi:MAG: sulfite exporter TauE/SafE family protein [Bacteriovoracaceae bacterium]
MGLGGSLHCLGMCGPLVMSMTTNKKENLIYQIGRLGGYISLGLVIKLIGSIFFLANQSILIIIAGLLLGIFYIIQGLSMLQLMKEIKMKPLAKLTEWARKKLKTNRTPILTGFLTAFLPCGLLYTTLFSLLVVQNFGISLLSLFAFWVGTLPALVFSPILMEKAIKPILLKVPKFAGVALLCMGLFTLAYRVSPLIQGKDPKKCPHCHESPK